MDERMFPILYGYNEPKGELKSIPWDMIAPHEAQARSNHSQSLTQLASRGGLGQDEVLLVLTDTRANSVTLRRAAEQVIAGELKALVDAWTQAREEERNILLVSPEVRESSVWQALAHHEKNPHKGFVLAACEFVRQGFGIEWDIRMQYPEWKSYVEMTVKTLPRIELKLKFDESIGFLWDIRGNGDWRPDWLDALQKALDVVHKLKKEMK